jgi:hypothetical protein
MFQDIVADGANHVVCITSSGQVARSRAFCVISFLYWFVFWIRFGQTEEKAIVSVNLDDRLTCLAFVATPSAEEQKEEDEQEQEQEKAKAAEPKKKQKTKK